MQHLKKIGKKGRKIMFWHIKSQKESFEIPAQRQ
jgi:hypothetical protein